MGTEKNELKIYLSDASTGYFKPLGEITEITDTDLEDGVTIDVPDLSKAIEFAVEFDLFGEKLTKRQIKFCREHLWFDPLAMRFPKKKNRRKRRMLRNRARKCLF